MDHRLRSEALANALASMDKAISALEALQEQHEQRGSISPATLETLIAERETVTQAINEIEKVLQAKQAATPALQGAAANDLTLRSRCTHPSHRRC